MSISKRLRFEVLKRHGFACTYCGRRPPEVELHVDHVVALANGGTDAIGNLTSACRCCNLGKAAVPLTESRVGDPAPRAKPAPPRYTFPKDDGSWGPPIYLPTDDDFLWGQSREPWSRFMACVDLVRRSEAGMSTSPSVLSQAWKWSRSRVRRFVRGVVDDGSVVVVSDATVAP